MTRLSSRSFVYLFCISIITSLLAVAALNIYFNPWQDYGEKGTQFIYNDRRTKVEYLNSLPADSLPEVYVFGSSVLMRMMPASIERELKRPAFNFCVLGASTDDYYCIISYLVNDLGLRDGLIIIGLDSWVFQSQQPEHPVFPGIDRRLLNCPALVKYHPSINIINATWANVVDALSMQQTLLSVSDLRNHNKRQMQVPLEDYHGFNTDGTLNVYQDLLHHKGNIRDLVDTGQYDINEYMEHLKSSQEFYTHPGYLRYRIDQFSDEKIELFDKAIALSGKNGIRMILILNPVHPVFTQLLESHFNYDGHLAHFKSIITSLKNKYDNIPVVFDATDLASFGGSDRGFYDAIHPSTPNSDLLLKKAVELYRERAAR